jgi:predicted dithiol-disulfide oxidoreductase (DUF899 family)
MAEHKVGTREEWHDARNALLEREKELTRRNEELARERREHPWNPSRQSRRSPCSGSPRLRHSPPCGYSNSAT